MDRMLTGNNKILKNWSSNFSFCPESIVKPTKIKEVTAILQYARKENKCIRAIGSNHSFTELVQTKNILLSLENFSGIEEINKSEDWAIIRGGTKLYVLTKLLAEQGYALPILGDIDKQTISGAISTGTHGTGITFGNISSFVLEMTLVKASGDVETINKKNNPEVFSALQLSLGCLGIIVYVKISILPFYYLHVKKYSQLLENSISRIETDITQNRNYEFFFFPNSNTVYTKTMNLSNDKKLPRQKFIFQFINDILVENCLLRLLCEINLYFPKLRNFMLTNVSKIVPNESYLVPANQAYATLRYVKFKEMEYAIPLIHAKDVINEMCKYFKKNKINTIFPIEIRFTHMDDIYLSPAYQCDVAYIGVHAYAKESYLEYFYECESIFKKYNGRPHWGKLHTMTSYEFEKLYPKWNTFLAIREQYDPNGLFLNGYLRRLFCLLN